MAAPAHLRLTWKGVFGTAAAPIEQWQFSLKGEYSVFPDPAPINGQDTSQANWTNAKYDQLALGMRTAYNAGLTTLMPTDVILTETRVEFVNGDGHVAKRGDGSYVQGVRTDATVAGTNTGTAKFPTASALCVSLQSARAGASGKGRFYLPMPPFTLGSDRRISTADQSLASQRVGDFLAAVQGDITAALVIASPRQTVLSPVVSYKVGRVVDTQRRRRGDMVESYLSAPLGA